MSNMTKTSERAELVMGELVGGNAEPQPLDCPVNGVAALQKRQRSGRIVVESRLYECANGLALACRRGGPLHMADAKSWEIAVMDERRIVHGNALGWVSEETLLQAVTRLAAWTPLDEQVSA